MWPDPFQRLPFLGLGRAVPFPAGKQGHQQVERIIAVAGKCQGREAGLPCVDPQLLFQLTDQRHFGRFACLDLAAREFP